MNGSDLVTSLQDVLGRAKKRHLTDGELANQLGVSLGMVRNWKKDKAALKPGMVSQMVLKAQQVAAQQAEQSAIRPIVEFFQINLADSPQGAQWELFDIKDGGDTARLYLSGLRKRLENSHGVYIFYDSRGRALYSGKAKQLTLWKEMNNALNRSRGVQKIKRVYHPESNIEFSTPGERIRQIRSESVELYELASYVSAYEVAPNMIGIVESMLIRSFANDLLNVKMEKFGGGLQNDPKKRKVRKKAAS